MIEIAIDGTAASGKGTLARKLAQKYNFAYLDTGLLYRKVAKELLKKVYNEKDIEDVSCKIANNINLLKLKNNL